LSDNAGTVVIIWRSSSARQLQPDRAISFPQTKLKKPAIQAMVAQLIHSLARKRACQLLMVIASIYFCKLKAGVDLYGEAMGD